MKMSSFQIILLAVFGAFAVAGILIFAFLVGSNSSASIGSVTLWGTLDDVAMQTVIRQLSEDDNRLRQVMYVKKNAETFEQELTNALASGTGPDLYILPSDNAVIDAPKITAIPFDSFSKEQFQSLFVEAASPFLVPDGVLAVPLTVDPLVLFWNRDLLSAAGFAQPPKYWNEVSDMARTITDCQHTQAQAQSAILGCDETRTIKKATIPFGEYENVDHAKDLISLLIVQAGGSITTRDSAGTLQPSLSGRGTATAAPGDSALTFYTSFADPSKDVYSWNGSLPHSRAMFASGDLALYLAPASEAALIKQQNPNLNFAMAPVPQARGTGQPGNIAHAYGFAVPRASKNPAGALTVAYLLASPTASKDISIAIGQSSARRDVVAEPTHGNDDLVNRQTLLAKNWEDPDPVQTDMIFRDMIESITSGSSKVNEATKRADQAMRQINSGQ